MVEERKKESAHDREIMKQHSRLLSLSTVYMENAIKEKNYSLPEDALQNTQHSFLDDSGCNESLSICSN